MKLETRSFLAPLSIVFLLPLLVGQLWAGGLYERDIEDADFSNSTVIDNDFWPLVPGTEFTYFAETEDGCEWNRVTVTYDTRMVDGIESVVVFDREWLDETEECTLRRADYPVGFPYGDLAESTFDWYAQDELKNIWYMGEDTSSYDWEEGECETVSGDACKDGSFEAGVGEAEAGIVMLGSPAKGDFYRQEYDPENAEDMAKVLNFVGADDAVCLKTKEWSRLQPGAVEHKYYCSDTGFGFATLFLIEHVSGGPKVWVELFDVQL